MNHNQIQKASLGRRDNNYDWLRVFAMCMVILNHVADYYLVKLLYNPTGTAWGDRISVYIYETISHCAVPIFLMLTGVYIIDKAAKISPKEFYITSVKKLGIPFVLFVIIYYVYDICIAKTKTASAIYEGISTGFKGVYAHWYMVMLAVIYAFVPLLAFIKTRVSSKTWTKGTVVFFIWAMASRFFENSTATWSLGNMYLIGYVLLGNVIHQRVKSIKKKSNLLGLSIIALGVIILTLNGLILEHIVASGGSFYNKFTNTQAAPLKIIGSVLIFTGFSMLTITKGIKLLSSLSYIVFLLHKLIIDIISKSVYPVLEKQLNNNISLLVPVEFIIVFILSILFGYMVFRLLNSLFYRKR